ncbi:hypothetical protein [Mycolicibacterium litorale]|uniref:Uncharacterized protein n=1 Tax=Mycolicibacterium litorale TaxID=758802 RepID=A0AAD1MUI0_9MYCO|nr:hypothetical protein [Mycolicibacterium litorale]TDY08469.1 hypothetical protein BCL50_0533 [Mycolicibacterium litorale]BBY16392.1 hypothetical protein MLIT_19840 [Mycolicibacterium litorale]
MAQVLDPNGAAWSVHRQWWPFPGVFDLTFDLFSVVIALPFVVLWPFWLATKWLGGRWTIIVERDGHEVKRERVRGWRRSQGRIADVVMEIAQGARSGRFVI